MDEAVLLAITSAAMLPAERADSLSGDLEKIEAMTRRAAEEASENKTDKTPEKDFSVRTGISGEEKTALRCDEEKKCPDRNIISQSKRYEGVYTSVPRIV